MPAGSHERPRPRRAEWLARWGRWRSAPGASWRSAPGWRLGAPLVFALAGLLAATSASTARGTDLRSSGGRDLADSIRAEQRRVDDQLRRVTALRAEIDRLTADLGGTPPGGAAGEVRHAAGFAPVSGPAITVSLDDAPRKPGTPLPEGVNPDDVIVHQQDVQGVVNALWAGGAEAMQLMDQRVVSTSAVRCVGNVLILQGRQYPPPYTVTAIGPVDRMRDALERAPAVQVYREYVERVGLRYQQRTLDRVTLPGYTGASELQHARVRTDTSTVTPRPTSPSTSPTASPTTSRVRR